MEEIPLALAYDDVLLVPRHSSVKTRREVNHATQFTSQIALKAPLVSSNMDTVTEAKMAIALAEFGGIGVIHRFLPIEAQVAEVTRVKRHQGQVIEDFRSKPSLNNLVKAVIHCHQSLGDFLQFNILPECAGRHL